MSDNMIMFHKGSKRFNYRAVGVMIHDNRVLIHRGENDSFWALPGGRVEFHETSAETLVREMQEELGIDVHVERLLWVSESFYEHEGKSFHEIGFYHLLKLPENYFLFNQVEEFEGEEQGDRLIFKWYPISRLNELELYPLFLKRTLSNISEEIKHIIEREY